VPQITRAEAKLFCRVEHFDDDALIDQLILSATKHVERITGWALNPQTQQKSHKRFVGFISLYQEVALVSDRYRLFVNPTHPLRA
jgi:Phage gp6-like head-tail connector protein